MDLSIDNSGQVEIALAPENLRILAAAMNQVVDTADWEFHSLMGVWPEEAQPVADKLREIVDYIATNIGVSDVTPVSQGRIWFDNDAGGIKLVQSIGETVRLSLTDTAILIVRNALNTVIGAYGQADVLANRAGVPVVAVRAFTDEFFDRLLATGHSDCPENTR